MAAPDGKLPKPIWPFYLDKPYALVEYDIEGDTAVFLCVDGWFATLEEGNTVLMARQGWLKGGPPDKVPRDLHRIYRLKLTPFVPVSFKISDWLGKPYNPRR